MEKILEMNTEQLELLKIELLNQINRIDKELLHRYKESERIENEL